MRVKTVFTSCIEMKTEAPALVDCCYEDMFCIPGARKQTSTQKLNHPCVKSDSFCHTENASYKHIKEVPVIHSLIDCILYQLGFFKLLRE